MNIKTAILTVALLSTLLCPKALSETATWYGAEYDGAITASGEPFNMNALTAASNTYPLGSVLLVTHNVNGLSVTVTVNDTGGFGDGIDLSYGAANVIKMVDEGVADVTITRVR